jgi:hypothetical protein
VLDVFGRLGALGLGGFLAFLSSPEDVADSRYASQRHRASHRSCTGVGTACLFPILRLQNSNRSNGRTVAEYVLKYAKA